jgi:N-acyl-phosphatidylethanolamine-hydrolysing phospholipase D
LFIAVKGKLRSRHKANLPPHHTGAGFRNTGAGFRETARWDLAVWILGKLGEMLSKGEAVSIASMENDGSHLRMAKDDTVTWVGHTTVLIQLEGKNILTDPVWASRAGPMNMFGPPRLTKPGIALTDLPPIDIVLLSHNHYDHLDALVIRKLAENGSTKFFVPLGMREWFTRAGIVNVQEMDWWESTRVLGLHIACTPSQHFSGRGVGDRNSTLWGSWCVEGKTKKFFFAGDSGYCAHFKEIGTRLGPFDLSLMPIGAYAPRQLMRAMHMNPDEAVQASLDVGARVMLATHWGSYKLTDERPDEPPKKMEEAIRARYLPHENYWVFMLGETRKW